MNFDDAMASHIVWKLRLARFIDGSGAGDFDTGAVGKTDLCELGKWMLDKSAKHQSVPAFASLQKKHAEFHTCAAEVVRKAESGDQTGARAVISGPLEAASRGIVRAIAELREQMAEG